MFEEIYQELVSEACSRYSLMDEKYDLYAKCGDSYLHSLVVMARNFRFEGIITEEDYEEVRAMCWVRSKPAGSASRL